jgi:hypothetical protein
LPPNLTTGLQLLERGHAIRNGGKMPEGKLPEKVLEIFNRLEEAEVDWVLVGAEAVNLYVARPRATVDVDIVVSQKHLRRVKKLLKETCVAVKDTEVVLRALISPEPNRLSLDAIKSQSHELFDLALKHQVSKGGVRVVRVEALLALKYLSAVSPNRSPEDKRMDASDFGRVYKQNRKRIDHPLLLDLASRAHRGARKEFEAFLDAIAHDRPLTI